MISHDTKKRRAHRAVKSELPDGWVMRIMSYYIRHSNKFYWHLKFDTKASWSRYFNITAYWNAGYESWKGVDEFNFKFRGDTNWQYIWENRPPVLPNDFPEKTRQFWEVDLPKLQRCVEVVCMEMSDDPMHRLLKQAKLVEEKNGGEKND